MSGCADHIDALTWFGLASSCSVSQPGLQKWVAPLVDDIRTQDKAQGMMAKLIGKETAKRIFYEVTT